MALMFIYI
uniref:Uncharacterized protein n=1 Tax=Rhizophora mucronata TaxID=61149 RepID=A0A2P2PJA5_RHIMU